MILSLLWWILLILLLFSPWTFWILDSLGIWSVPDTKVVQVIGDIAQTLSWGCAIALLNDHVQEVKHQIKNRTALMVFLSVVVGLLLLRFTAPDFLESYMVLYSLSMLFSPIFFMVILFITRD